MKTRNFGVVLVCGWLMASGSLLAHHSLAGVYDMKKEAEVSRTLTKIQFVNPHGSMTITVKNPDGTTTALTSVAPGAGSLAQADATLGPGTYTLFCALPGHEAAGMRASLLVV